MYIFTVHKVKSFLKVQDEKNITLPPQSLPPLIPAPQRQQIPTSLTLFLNLYHIFLNNLLIILYFEFLIIDTY